ncbi:coenzyme F420-0:L-glutamate ligase [Methanosphaera stadtmanae]|uniref:coenzyme F420-0:L-glutamate ligase n=1 Tax=Methanosphaera stadtmanae TaxID=2317 RepID=UPI002E769F41|nr:coenzyme F420-0:L-glutamate ligase [Methanosphaera stadtmanae]MEE0490121.1 coenzyme F420-0:L-glutamate ligase [Methanosphaera stadtmanae]
MSLEIIGVENFPIIEENDDLSRIICDTLNYNNIKLEDDDVLVLAETVVSKAEGNYVKIEDVVVSDKAKNISLKSGKDAKQCQIILDNTKKIIRCQTGLIITETPHGFICANSGIDNSNCREGYVTPLPVDADRSARCIKKYLDEVFDVDVSVIISDTQGRPWRVGAVGVAIGISGIHPCTDFRGSSDLYGQELMSTIEGTADELASAASLVMGQSDNGICLVLIRGYDNSLVKCAIDEASISESIRDEETDVFR